MKKVHTETVSFGDQALLNDKPRMARVITQTDCHFITMSKFDFKTCIAKFN